MYANNILSIGSGPFINIKAKEGIESHTVNMYAGSVNITAQHDGIEVEKHRIENQEPSMNRMGGDLTIHAEEEGIDSEGNVNLINGHAEIHSGEDMECIKFEEDLYVSPEFEPD